MISAVVGHVDSNGRDDEESSPDPRSFDDEPAIEMLEDDEDVDNPYLPPPVPFAITFVAVPPLPLPLLPPVLLYADDETDLLDG